MFCTNCGKEVTDDALFCANCGTRIEKIETNNESIEVNNVQESSVEYVPKETKAEDIVIGKETEDPEGYDYRKLPTKQETGIHSIYILDFMSRMIHKSNIPLFIYLILNAIIIGVITSAILALPIGWGMLSGCLIYIASVIIALSPIGEFILRYQNGCKKIEEKAVVDRIAPIFHEVYYKAKKEFPVLSNDIRLFINEDESPNAFATGRKTICITRGLLALSDEEIKATLGHEFGHLVHKDTDRILVVAIGNTAITAICMLFQLGVIISNFIMSIVAIFVGDDEGFFISFFNAIATFISLVFVRGFMKVWTMLGVALCMKTSRGNEYLADKFSFELGYGDGLCKMLANFSGEKPRGLFASLASSHPESSARIARLQEMGASYE